MVWLFVFWFAIADAGNAVVVAGGDYDEFNNSTMIYSTDGLSFVRTPVQLFLVKTNEVRFWPYFGSEGRWVAVGRNNFPSRCILWSDDGISWTGHTGSDCSSSGFTHGFGMCYGAGTLMAVGQPAAAGSAIMTSNNGTHFVPQASLGSGPVHACSYSPAHSRFVAVGAGSVNTIWFSDDNGVSWTGLGMVGGGSCVRRVLWMFDKFIASASNGTQVLFSPLGNASWNAGTISEPLGEICRQGMLKFRDSAYLVGEGGRIYTTSNGVNWTKSSSIPFDVYGRDITILSWPLTLFIAAGNDRYMSKSTNLGQSFSAVGGSRSPSIGFPGQYNSSGELATVGAVGFFELDGSPIPTAPFYPFNIAVTAKAIEIVNKSFAFTAVPGIFDAIGADVTLRNSTLYGYAGSYLGTTLRLISSQVNMVQAFELKGGFLFTDSSSSISCSTANISNVALSVTILTQPTSGDISVTLLSFNNGAVGGFSNAGDVSVNFALSSGQNVCVVSRGVPFVTVTATEWVLKIPVIYCTTTIPTSTTMSPTSTTNPTVTTTTSPSTSSILSTVGTSSSSAVTSTVWTSSSSAVTSAPQIGCPSGANCSCVLLQCILEGDFTLPSNVEFPLRDDQITIVRGNLTFSSFSRTSLTLRRGNNQVLPGAPLLTVRGRVILSGVLRFVLEAAATRSIYGRNTVQTVTVVNASSISGTYGSIEANSASSCESVSSSPQYSSSSLSVTLTVTNTCTSAAGGLSTGAIVGIAVGAAVGAGVLIAVLVCVCWNRQKARRSAEISDRIFANTYNRKSNIELDEQKNRNSAALKKSAVVGDLHSSK